MEASLRMDYREPGWPTETPYREWNPQQMGKNHEYEA